MRAPRRPLVRLLLCWTLLLGVVGAPALHAGDAGAQARAELSAPEQAHALYLRGNQEYVARRYAAALKLYEQAYRLNPLSKLLFNRAQAHRRLGQFREALPLYREFLEREPGAINRSQVGRIIAVLEKEVGALPIPPTPPVPEPAPPTPVAPPATTLLPAAPSPSPAIVTVPAAGAESLGHPWYRRWYVWTGVGAVVVGAVLTGVLVSQAAPGTPTFDRPSAGTMHFFGAR